MKKGEKAYRKLKKQGLSDKEIAESFILPYDLTKKEKAKADKELWKIRKKKLDEMTKKDIALSKKMQKKFKQQDTRERDYFLSDDFKKSFNCQVKKDSWEKGFPMVYMNEKGQIVKHWKNGKIQIIKKSRVK